LSAASSGCNKLGAALPAVAALGLRVLELGHPTFFVDGQRHEEAATTDGLVAAIEGGPAAYRL